MASFTYPLNRLDQSFESLKKETVATTQRFAKYMKLNFSQGNRLQEQENSYLPKETSTAPLILLLPRY
jgi:hypothetical protein